MKFILQILLIIYSMFSFSCQKCELLEQTITYPPIDTMSNCEGVFYINKAETSIDLSFFFNEFNKPIPNPLEYAAGPGPNPVNSTIFAIESNFSALDSINDQYVFVYRYTDGVTPFIRFHHHDITNFTSTFSSPMSDYGSPVFLNGKLYAIKVTHDTLAEIYQIVEVNPLNGQEMNILDMKSITVNSPFTIESMSSVSDGNGNIYFLSGTNLIEVKASSGNSQLIDIDLSYNAIDNAVDYTGLEFKKDQGVLLAIRHKPEPGIGITNELVSIIPGFPSTVTAIFDISGHLPAGQDKMINHDLHATTYDQCDNAYYITEPLTINPSFTTNFIEINLKKNELKTRNLTDYWYGPELGPKR